MLIVDMPMPSRCFDCFIRLSCERYAQELEMVDNLEELKALLPNDKCLIKDELPEEHGRLIDASTVIGIQQDEEDNDFPVTVDDYLGLRFPVPTIVPATERSET